MAANLYIQRDTTVKQTETERLALFPDKGLA
jgi:hypothetical protein